jgi:hypothetical protein
MVYDCWWTRVFELKWLSFLDLSMVDRRLHDDLRKIYLRLKAPRFDLHRPNTVTGCLQAQVEGSLGRQHPRAGDEERDWSETGERLVQVEGSLGRQHPQDIADEAQKAETGPVFNKIWFMIVGGLEYLS